MCLEQGKKYSEVTKIIYKTDKYTSVLENVKYCRMLSDYIRYVYKFTVGPMLHLLYSIHFKNTFWMCAFYIFYLIFILQIIIRLCSDYS